MVRSDTVEVRGSIPQGSVLGCLLFLVYINDLPKEINEKCTLFADDVSVLFEFSKNEYFNTNLAQTLDQINSWMSDHNLLINTDKTKLIQFYPYQKPSLQLELTINDKKIEEVGYFTLLGITLDTHMNWKNHISNIKTKISKFQYALFTLRKNTNFSTALSAYYAYAHSWLRYGIAMWGNSTNVHELFVMQKKCMRILVGVPNRESCKPHFVKHGILTLPCLYIYELCMYVRKNIHLFKKQQNRRLQYTYKLTLPESTIKAFQNSPHYAAVKYYNEIPDHIKKEESDKAYGKKLKSFLAQKCFYTAQELFEVSC